MTEIFLTDKICNGVSIEFKYDDKTLSLKLFVLLYADDTVFFCFVFEQMKRNFKRI